MQDKLKGGAARAARWRAVAALAASLALFGCATGDGASFLAAAQKAGGPKPGHARVYIYPSGGPDNVSIALDGQLIGELTAGSYMMREIPPGGHELTSETQLYPGVTRFTFSIAAGRNYYYMAQPSEGAKTMQRTALWTLPLGTTVSVMAGMTAGAFNAGNGGPVKFVSVPEGTAAPVLAGLSAR